MDCVSVEEYNNRLWLMGLGRLGLSCPQERVGFLGFYAPEASEAIFDLISDMHRHFTAPSTTQQKSKLTFFANLPFVIEELCLKLSQKLNQINPGLMLAKFLNHKGKLLRWNFTKCNACCSYKPDWPSQKPANPVPPHM